MPTLIAIVAGLISWSFLEYALHHWLGHLGRGRNPFSKEHLRHHARSDYFSPFRRKLSLALPVLTGLALLAWPLVGLGLSSLYAASVGVGWLAYEALHYRLHHVAPRNAWGRYLRRHHFYHHFHQPFFNHGVTSPIWDLCFGTQQHVSTAIQVPRSQALPWLLDSQQQIKPEFARDYQLRG